MRFFEVAEDKSLPAPPVIKVTNVWRDSIRLTVTTTDPAAYGARVYALSESSTETEPIKIGQLVTYKADTAQFLFKTTAFDAGVNYKFYARSVNQNEHLSGLSPHVSFQIPYYATQKPTEGFQAYRIGNMIEIIWDYDVKSPGSILGFNLYKKNELNETWTRVNQDSLITGNRYTDRIDKLGQVIEYKLHAVDMNGREATSASEAIVNLPSQDIPVAIISKAWVVHDNSVVFEWSIPQVEEKQGIQFKLIRMNEKQKEKVIHTILPSESSGKDSKLKPGFYSYYIKTINSNNTKEASSNTIDIRIQ